jgi:hypothetical protein
MTAIHQTGRGSGTRASGCEKVMAVRTILRRCLKERERFRDDEVDHERQREDCRERERVDHERGRVDSEKDVTTFLLLLSVEYKRRRRERERKKDRAEYLAASTLVPIESLTPLAPPAPAQL